METIKIKLNNVNKIQLRTTNETRTDVSRTDIYPHMPILRPHAVRSCVQEPNGNRCERRGGDFLAWWPIFPFLGF